MNKLLYYPTISISDSSWLPKALLYWDGLATIAPEEYLRDPSRFSSLMQDLIRENLVEVVQPEEYSYTHYEEFTAFFEWALCHADSFALKPSRGARISRSFYKLHTGKLGAHLRDEFVRAGLARHISYEWFLVDQELGEAFMTFLAVLIGQETDRDAVTDDFQGISSLFYANQDMDSWRSANLQRTLRNSMLEKILPVPEGLSGIEGLQKVQHFKDHYHDELERFRRRIEDFILSVDGQSTDIQDKRRKIFLKDVQEEIDELKGHMGWFRAPQIDLGTFITALPSAVSVLSGEITPAATAVSIAALVGETTYNRERAVNRKKPLAYAALYQQQHGRYLKRRLPGRR